MWTLKIKFKITVIGIFITFLAISPVITDFRSYQQKKTEETFAPICGNGILEMGEQCDDGGEYMSGICSDRSVENAMVSIT